MDSVRLNPWIGVGTGRCGSNSLQRIVNACKNSRVWHEGFQMRWYEVNEELGLMIKTFRGVMKKGIKPGDVSQVGIMHVENLRSSFRHMPVVCLHRDKEEVIRSFMDFNFYHFLRPSDKRKWADSPSDSDGQFARAMRCFPIIDAVSHEQAYGFYWEMYEALMAGVAEPVFHIQTNELNDDAKIVELFDFLSIPESDRVFIERRKFWTREETQAIRREMKRARFV